MKKKFWFAILAVIMVLPLAFALTACDKGDNPPDNGDGGEDELVPTKGIKYEVTEDGAGFCVTGIESIEITELVIPSTYLNKPVVAIAKNAFSNCVLLESIVIPDSVVSIGENAFKNTAYYENLSNWRWKVLYIGKHLIKAQEDIAEGYWVNDGTITIADSAFWFCEHLTSVTIPDSVVTVGSGAFGYCTALKSATIGNGVKTIGYSAFINCNALGSVDMGDSVVTIGQYAFQECAKLKSIELPATLKTMGYGAFKNCNSLSDVYLHDIGAWCNVDFRDATANPLDYANNLYLNGVLVTEIVIPDGVTVIGNYAFNRLTTLTKVTIPKSVTKLGRQAFSYCTSLTEIYYTGGIWDFYHVDKTNNGYDTAWNYKIGKNIVYCTDGYYYDYVYYPYN